MDNVKEEIEKILWENEELLSDGFEYYAGDFGVNKVAEALSSYIKEREREAIEGFIKRLNPDMIMPFGKSFPDSRYISQIQLEERAEQYLNERTNEIS